ncbi:hypothetical protein ACLOJK_004193 [Asimina triloba]
MARRMYRYVDYSPTAITLAIKENWPLLATITAAKPSRKADLILLMNNLRTRQRWGSGVIIQEGSLDVDTSSPSSHHHHHHQGRLINRDL